MRLKLVNDWRSSGKWWSVRFTALLASLGPIWLSLPSDIQDMLKQSIPAEWLPYITPIVLVIAIARVIDQDTGQ